MVIPNKFSDKDPSICKVHFGDPINSSSTVRLCLLTRMKPYANAVVSTVEAENAHKG